jgi:DNA-binding NtrC family response regulator
MPAGFSDNVFCPVDPVSSSSASPSSDPRSAPPPARVRVLYADDEADVREVFAAVFAEDFDVVCVESGQSALAALAEKSFDVLVTDMRMHPMKGSELVARAFEAHPDVQRVIVTGFTDHGDLAEAVNRGHVYAYVQKPWAAEQLKLTILRAAEARRLEMENRRLLQELRAHNARLQADVEVAVRAAPRPRLRVTSPAMVAVMEQVEAVAATDASVLLSGETGVGKELVAAAIHERSRRRRGRFVAQNLAALPAELMASELFGHVKGAFTGAQQSRRGLFELADGGTLFLDEIGEAPASLQAILLRALETREFWPVGGSEPRRSDLRIIAATNRDLLSQVQAGAFRQDLYYRLAVCPIEIPPLRRRPEDVRGLGEPLLESAARRMGREPPRLTEAAWRALERHVWPGNVRELGNVMERLAIYFPGREVDVEGLALPLAPPTTSMPPPPSVPTSSAPIPSPPPSRPPFGFGAPLPPMPPPSRPPAAGDPDPAMAGTLSLSVPEGGTTFDDLEREILAQVLARADGNQSRAARALGMSESTLRSRLKRLGLKGDKL